MAQNVTPNAQPLRISPLEPEDAPDQKPQPDAAAEFRRMAGQFGISFEDSRPRVVLSFPQNPNDMLLSGTLANGQFLSNRAALVDMPLGKGHVVMFAIRPFWRWQTQGTYSLGFNALMNWNDLDAGKAGAASTDIGGPAGISFGPARTLSIPPLHVRRDHEGAGIALRYARLVSTIDWYSAMVRAAIASQLSACS